ncbi:MAG: hypothetical protein AAGE03_02755 [Pseudomonadota bacterium]
MSSLLETLPHRHVPEVLRAGLDRLMPLRLGLADLDRLRDAAEVAEATEAKACRWENGARARFRAARREGYEAGQAQAMADLATERIDFATRLADLRAEQASQLDALLLEAMRRLFGDAPWDDLMRRAVRQALAELPSVPRPVLVGAGPDLDRLARPSEISTLPVTFEPDDSMCPGEVELRSLDGAIRISLDRHLNQLAQALRSDPAEDNHD